MFHCKRPHTSRAHFIYKNFCSINRCNCTSDSLNQAIKSCTTMENYKHEYDMSLSIMLNGPDSWPFYQKTTSWPYRALHKASEPCKSRAMCCRVHINRWQAILEYISINLFHSVLRVCFSRCVRKCPSSFFMKWDHPPYGRWGHVHI